MVILMQPVARFRIKVKDFEVEWEGPRDVVESKWHEVMSIVSKVGIPSTERMLHEEEQLEHEEAGFIEIPQILEVVEGMPKFTFKALEVYRDYELIAILLHASTSPLSPQMIAEYLSRSKKITSSAIRSHLTSSKSKLKNYVINIDGKYKLTREGEVWVKQVLLPKITA